MLDVKLIMGQIQVADSILFSVCCDSRGIEGLHIFDDAYAALKAVRKLRFSLEEKEKEEHE